MNIVRHSVEVCYGVCPGSAKEENRQAHLEAKTSPRLVIYTGRGLVFRSCIRAAAPIFMRCRAVIIPCVRNIGLK